MVVNTGWWLWWHDGLIRAVAALAAICEVAAMVAITVRPCIQVSLSPIDGYQRWCNSGRKQDNGPQPASDIFSGSLGGLWPLSARYG